MSTPRSLECSVCLQAFVNPVQLPCGHSFCFLCVKGVANVSHTCALCRKPFSREFIDKPTVLAADLRDDESLSLSRHVWYYEGRNGWWMYDQRTNDDIDRAFRDAERRVEILIVGHLYVIDFENMLQYRLNDTQRRRRIKYDLISAPKKGVGGLKFDRERFSRRTPVVPSNDDAPVVPSLASSVPSIIASSTSESRSRSDADGGEPVTRQPADGLGNPQTTWRTRTNDATREQRVTSDSESEDDDSVPPSSRLRPVLIGGEDQTLLINLSLDTHSTD